MPTPEETAVAELTAEINRIDFTGGLVSAGVTPAPSTPAVPESKPAGEPKPTLEPKPEPKEEPKPAEEPTGAEPSTPVIEPVKPAEEPKADDQPAIPDSHYRAAIHMGAKPEQIAKLYDADPEVALEYVAKCHEMVNASSKQLGELGQKARQMQTAPAAPVQPTVSRKEVVMRKLKEKYEDDPIIDLIGELIPDTPAPTVTPERPQPAAPAQDIEQVIAIRQQINTFFGTDDMNLYGEFYGKVPQTGDWSQLTPGQRANRKEVCDRAQGILDGAAVAGMTMSTADALERAHLEVAAPMAEQVVRERITASMQKRAKGVTLKPSGSKTPAPTGDTYSKGTAIQEMGAELKKVFG
jgi:hypothetical protein